MSARPFAWELSYPPGLRWDVPIEISTIPALFDRAVAEYGERPFLEFRGRKISYGELGARAGRAAAGFIGIGHDRTRPIALYLPNTPCHPIAFFGGLKAGATLVHLSPLDAERELAHKLTDSGARTIVTTNFPAMLPLALKMLDQGLADRVIVDDDADWGQSSIALLPIPERPDVIRFSAFCEAAPPAPALWPETTPDDIALLQYTGGTTGKPKGAMLSHANLTAALSIYDRYDEGQEGLRENFTRRGEEIAICVLPLFHIYALTTVLLRAMNRGSLILLRVRFDVEQTLHDIEKLRATAFPGVPTMWIALANRPDIAERDLSSLTFCGSGGASLPVEVKRRFEQLTGHRLAGGWGMTETSPAGTSVPSAFGTPPPASIGLPLPGIEMGIVAIEDPSHELGPHEVGEIRIKGPNVTRGYWRRPEETASAFVGGYLLTGDIGYMDEMGYFFIIDRKKDMIICGGFNVYPQMVEQAIYEHPAVEEVLVVGVPDSYRGESAKAFVKLKAGASEFTLDELHGFLGDKVGRYEMPSQLEFREALPRTAVGKLSKVALKQEEQAKARAAEEAELSDNPEEVSNG
ncbi:MULTISPECIES: dicarboxylate--CoA ligase PimA [Rhodomicrobium]|uniref:dicarboxylate--CoA ligase PimA n=1 Tax=Rhodomicrobium TaxID=1068 RepID=UPI000B4BB3D7|nr:MULTISPECIES: dicarboxylate--CoA ligase PimA [Rhodomicrobium]